MGDISKGILGTKVGITQNFDEASRVIPVTVVQAGPCRVSAVRTVEKDGYSAIQLAFREISQRKPNRPELRHLKTLSRPAIRHRVGRRLATTHAFARAQASLPRAV